MIRIGAFRVFMRIGPNSLSRAVDLAAVNHIDTKLSSELSRRLGPKVKFKELRLEPKFLNRGLRTHNRKYIKVDTGNVDYP